MASLTSRIPVRSLDHTHTWRDQVIDLADSDVSVAEVISALGLGAGPGATQVDGTPVGRHVLESRAVEVLGPGAELAPADPAGAIFSNPTEAVSIPGSASTGSEPVVEVAIAGGLDAGASTQLPIGRYRFGAPGPAGWYLAVDRDHLASTERLPWHEVGPTVEAVDAPAFTVALGKPVDSQPQHVGYVHRPPRPLAADAVAPIELEAAPKAVNDPQPLSWATLLGPIPIAIVMAVFFRPMFAIFAAMGPIIAIARWFEGRRRHRRDTAARVAEVGRIRAELSASMSRAAELEARRRWHHQPHVAELWRRAREHSARLWERRPGTPGHLCFTVGYAPALFEVQTDGAKRDPEVHEMLDRDGILRTVPHVVDLATSPGVGFHGDRDIAAAMVRSAVLQLATLHGPADLRVGIVAPGDVLPEWDWLKWLPHLNGDYVCDDIATVIDALAPSVAGQDSASNISFRADRELGQVTLIIVDDPSADVAALQRAGSAADVDVRVVALAPIPTMLPAVCTSLVEVGVAVARLSSPHLSAGITEVCPVGISPSTAGDWARSLAPMRDPEVLEFDVGGADEGVGLISLVGLEGADELVDRWTKRDPETPAFAPVGVGGAGPFGIDLAEDGPHALVAGTTGSGKSEFLRTLVLSLAAVCPPDELNFVLVDFKGGGAFDVCADLPHIAGLITDLDETLVARAINSLRAELHRRETLFRSLGVSRWEDAAANANEPVPRLVIVIDEFAALATDYNELLASIIDLAARGRSLGMHLVLATQRPSGVVDQKIRANTNLRVALRVQDSFDSQDVIGVPDAAVIDRKRPGRAIFSIGGDTPVTVQTSYTGAVDQRGTRCTVTPFRLGSELLPVPTGADAPGPSSRDATAVTAEGGSETGEATTGSASTRPNTELEVLVATIGAAAHRLQQVARPLWPDPLPECFDWIDLGARLLAADDRVDGLALGLVDLPDKQAQLPWVWDPSGGSLALYGSSAETSGRLLCSIGAAIASSSSADQAHLYVLDGDSGGCAPLATLPHTGAYVRGAESDRVERVVAHLERTLGERRVAEAGSGACDEVPRLILMIDNIAGLLGSHDEMEALQIVERLSALARDGAPQRIHLVITARTPRDLSHRLAQIIPTRLVASLADPAGYMTLGLKSNQVVPLPSMRVIDLVTHRITQLVEPPDLGDLAVAPATPGNGPIPIRSFPVHLPSSALDPAVNDVGTLRIPIGLESVNVDSADLVLRPGEHALIAGPPESGRTTMLEVIGCQLRAVGVDVYSVVAPGAKAFAAELGFEAVADAEALLALAEAERGSVVLIDDADRLADDMSKALEQLGGANHPNLHLVVAASPEHARAMRSNVSGVRNGGIGVLLGAGANDGDVLKVRRPKLHGLGIVPGRGHLVQRGRVTGVQFADAAGSVGSPTTRR